jgi:hypothetical protein
VREARAPPEEGLFLTSPPPNWSFAANDISTVSSRFLHEWAWAVHLVPALVVRRRRALLRWPRHGLYVTAGGWRLESVEREAAERIALVHMCDNGALSARKVLHTFLPRASVHPIRGRLDPDCRHAAVLTAQGAACSRSRNRRPPLTPK